MSKCRKRKAKEKKGCGLFLNVINDNSVHHCHKIPKSQELLLWCDYAFRHFDGMMNYSSYQAKTWHTVPAPSCQGNNHCSLEGYYGPWTLDGPSLFPK